MLVECRKCDARVDGRKAGGFEHVYPELGVPSRFVLLECPVCHSPIVIYQEIEQISAHDSDWSDPRRVFPADREVSYEVPERIRGSFSEALMCARAGANLATVIMCRRTLEGMAHHHLDRVRNLAAALEELHSRGVIDDRLREWADALRSDGNLAAHDPEATISKEDASDILDFTEAILEYVFVLHDRFEKFRDRRTSSREGPQG